MESKWMGVLVTDRQLKEEKSRRNEPSNTNYIILDDIPMDKDELEYLNLHYKFREIEPMTVEELENEVEIQSINLRYELMNHDDDNEEATQGENNKADNDERRKEYKESMKVLDEQEKKLDMTKLKVINLSKNPRLIEPRAAINNEEIKIQTQRMEMLSKGNMILESLDKRKESNLTMGESRGKVKLLKRIKNEELLIYPFDKSGKLVACLPSTYLEAGKVHTSKDEKVEWTELPKVELCVNRHTRALMKILNIGTSHQSQTQRMKGAFISEDSPAPHMYLMWKDHKEYVTMPPTRPVCSATVGPLVRASEILSIILTSFLDVSPGEEACQSSEEMQRVIEDTNKILEREGVEDANLFSMDVEALYPNMDEEDMIEAIQELVEESEIEVENVDGKELAKYIAVMIEKKEIEGRGLANIVPTKTVELEGNSKGKVTIAFLDSETFKSRRKEDNGMEREKWNWEGKMTATKEHQKIMMALMFREQVRVVITSHYYQYGGHLYKQLRGGPIGLKLTTIFSRALTRKFCSKYKATMDKLNLKLYLNKLYVDDLNAVARAVPRNVCLGRNEDGSLCLLTTDTSTDMDQDAHTAAIYRDVANTIMPRSIKMKEDVASNHHTEKLPILDMAMWVVDGKKFMHEHYTKLVSSKSVIMERSAFTNREKRNILMEEGNRRLRNCHPDLPWKQKAVFLTELNLSMMETGHTERFRGLVTTRVVARYRKTLRNHRLGRVQMYRNREEREEQRAEQGGKTTASEWMRKSGATTIVNISATKDNKLTLAIEQALGSCPAPKDTLTKVQERPGRSVRQILVRGNPFPRATCGRKYCPWVGRSARGPATGRG